MKSKLYFTFGLRTVIISKIPKKICKAGILGNFRPRDTTFLEDSTRYDEQDFEDISRECVTDFK